MGKSSRQRGPKVGERERGPTSWERWGSIGATFHKGRKKRCKECQIGKRMGGGRRTPGCKAQKAHRTWYRRMDGSRGLEKNLKEPQRKDPTPLGDSCQAVSLFLSMPSFSMSISPSFSLYVTYTYTPPQFPQDRTLLPPSPCFTPLLPLSLSLCTSTSIPHLRAKLAGTLTRQGSSVLH